MPSTSAFSRYLSELGHVGIGISKPYRNFFSWNFHKMSVFVYSTLAGLVLSAPFLLATSWTFWHLDSKISEAVLDDLLAFVNLQKDFLDPASFSFIVSNAWALGLIALFIVVMVSIMAFFYGYGYVALNRLYLAYDEERRLSLQTGYPWWDFRLMRRVFGVVTIHGLIFLVPTLVWMVGVFSASLLFGGLGTVGATIVGGVTVLYLLCLIVLIVRFCGAYLLLAEPDARDRTAASLVGESWTLGRRTFAIIAVAFPFVLILGIAASFFGRAETAIDPVNGSVMVNLVRFFLLQGLGQMVMATMYRRIRSGKFLADERPATASALDDVREEDAR